MTPREKVYRDALEGIGERTTNYKGTPCCVACGDWLERCTEDGKCSGAQARAALAAADAIPDAPVECAFPMCAHSPSWDAHTPCYTDCRRDSNMCHDIVSKPPVPSRAELIETVTDAISAVRNDPKRWSNYDMAIAVLDALIKAGAVRNGL